MKVCNKYTNDISLLHDGELDAFVEHTVSCEYHDYILTKYEESFLPLLRLAFDQPQTNTGRLYRLNYFCRAKAFLFIHSFSNEISIFRTEVLKGFSQSLRAARVFIIFIIALIAMLALTALKPDISSANSLPTGELIRIIIEPGPIGGGRFKHSNPSDTMKKQNDLTVQIRYAEMDSPTPDSVPTVLPHAGEIKNDYGYRPDPDDRRLTEDTLENDPVTYEFHPGIDIAGKTGDAVVASGSGKVTRVDCEGDYGNLVEIDHQNGFSTRYAHLSKIVVRVGDTVRREQLIGLVGSGQSTGAHLHYELRMNNMVINPRYLLRMR